MTYPLRESLLNMWLNLKKQSKYDNKYDHNIISDIVKLNSIQDIYYQVCPTTRSWWMTVECYESGVWVCEWHTSDMWVVCEWLSDMRLMYEWHVGGVWTHQWHVSGVCSGEIPTWWSTLDLTATKDCHHDTPPSRRIVMDYLDVS